MGNPLDKNHEEIRIQNTVLSAVQKYSPDGIIVVDADDNIISFNQRIVDMWNIEDLHSLTGQDFFSRISEQIVNKTDFINCLKSKIQENGLVFNNIITKHSELELYSAALSKDEDQATGTIWFFRDITSHKKTEKAKEQMRLDAENNAQMRSQFYALISHDIKTPLNAIIGFLNLLNSTGLNKKQQGYVDIIKASGDHLMVLISDILDLTKIEYGSLDLNIRPLSPRDLIDECVSTFIPALKERTITMNTEIDSDAPAIIYSDTLRLKQIIINLLNNAVKFTSEGSVTINCRKHDDNFVQISVIDTGIGISKDVQELIFAPFSQADESISKKYGGSGLGLAISKQLVEKLGGVLQLDSTLNKGSTFSFTVPIKKD